MDTNSPPPPHHSAATQPHTDTIRSDIGEAESSFHEGPNTILRTKSKSPKPPSRPSSVLPRILETFSSNPAVTSSTKPQSPGKRGQSPVIEIPLKSPTAHSDTCPSTPICGVPPFSPESERSSCGSASGNTPQQFCLRWNNYQSNLTSVFDQLLQNESFVDVTLACDGRSIKAHKMVLSACSPYFQTLFSTTPCQHPIVIMRDINWFELKSIVDFMYKGEINVSQDQIGPLLRIAEMLKVRGLADVSNIGALGSTAQISTRKEDPIITDVYSTQSLTESPKKKETVTSPPTSRPPSQTQDSDNNRDSKLFVESEKKDLWEPSGFGKPAESSNLEFCLSPVPQQHLLGRNVRKRRWPSADAIFNPPESPLSSLIAAERAEQERERERAREREREKTREISLLTPPMPVTSGSSGATPNLSSCVSTSGLEPSVHMDITSPSPTPTPTLLPPARTPSGILTPSPHLQMSHHHSHQFGPHQTHQAHQSHHSSPASSITSTHPSSILSRPLTPSPISTGHSTTTSRLESSQLTPGDSHRFPLGPAQAAAMAAAAAQLDLGASPAMSIRPHPPVASGPGSSHHSSSLTDDLEIKPGIAEMIREEERVSQSVFFLFKSSLKKKISK